MIFSQTSTPNPIGIPFNWAADYFDGSAFTEYDLISHKSNSFYSIRQEDVIRFGLFGNGSKFYFDMISGVFHLSGRRVEIMYVDEDDTVYNLTNNVNKKDLITYKQAYTNFNNNVIDQKTNIESINFGYKTVFNKKDTNLFFQPIVSLPFGSSAYIELKLTSDRDMDGHIVFYVSGKERERFYAPLAKGKSGLMNWTIK